jgi:hypothetical protein
MLQNTRTNRLLRSTVLAVICQSLCVSVLCLPAYAADCAPLGKRAEELQDAQLFYQPPNTTVWMPAGSAALQFGGKTLQFAYVVREQLAASRRGIIILKSGRPRQMTESVEDKVVSRVQLVRKYSSQGQGEDRVAENGTCGPIPRFGVNGEGDVSARSYDVFHDLGRAVSDADRPVIKSFHHNYVGREKRCRETDYDRTVDSRSSPPDPRYNRGQFSYDENVVGKSTPSQLAWYFSSTAIAEPAPPYAERRVELLRYDVKKETPACVFFKLTVPATNAFVRINDLEGLKQSGVYYVRADEQTWSLGN